jgi:hypothetical protein
MTAPAPVPVAIAVSANRPADRVMVQFGDQIFGLAVEDAVMLVDRTLAAVEILRPPAAPGVVQ